MKASHDERVPPPGTSVRPVSRRPRRAHNQFSGIRHGVLGRALRGARARLVSAAEPHLRAGCGEPDARTLPRPGCGEGADAIWLATQAGRPPAMTSHRPRSDGHSRPPPRRTWPTRRTSRPSTSTNGRRRPCLMTRPRPVQPDHCQLPAVTGGPRPHSHPAARRPPAGARWTPADGHPCGSPVVGSPGDGQPG